MLNFPPVVRIETTNACNATCIMCPHNNMRRRIQTMSDQLFGKIIDECAIEQRSGNVISEVHLHNFGEPLLDAGLEDRIKLVKAKCRTYVKIFTNGSLITPDRARKLLDSGINEIKISIDGSTPEEFEKIRFPLKWDVVSSNISNLIGLRDSLKLRTRIFITCCTGKSAAKLFDFPVRFAFGPKHNWGGSTWDAKASRPIKCNRLWRTFTILVDGVVARCHADVHGECCLGNINDQTIKQIWNNEAYNNVRELHVSSRQSELELCRDCSQCRR